MSPLFEAICCTIDRVINITNTATGQTLTDLGIALDPRLRRISFQNVGIWNIYVSYDRVPDLNSYCILPVNALDLHITVQEASRLRFLVAAGETGDMNVVQEGNQA